MASYATSATGPGGDAVATPRSRTTPTHSSRPATGRSRSTRSPAATRSRCCRKPSSRCRRRSVRCSGTPRSRAGPTRRSPTATGSTAQAVAAQAMRARRALGGAYLQRHIPNGAPAATMPPACADTRRQLADLVRDSISARGRRRLDAHLLSCPSCREARDELEQFNQHLRTAPGLPLAAGAGILRIGLKARVLGALATSSASLVAASGLVVVSTVVPLVVAHRASGDDRVAAVAEREVPATTTTAAPSDPTRTPGRRRRRAHAGRRRPDDDRGAAADDRAPVTRSEGRRRPKPGGGDDPGGAAPTTSAPAAPGPASPPTGGCSTVRLDATGHDVPTTPPITVLPPVELPPVSTPGVALPGVTTPAVSLPPVSLPVATVPSVTVPSITVPPTTVSVDHAAAGDRPPGHRAPDHPAAHRGLTRNFSDRRHIRRAADLSSVATRCPVQAAETAGGTRVGRPPGRCTRGSPLLASAGQSRVLSDVPHRPPPAYVGRAPESSRSPAPRTSRPGGSSFFAPAERSFVAPHPPLRITHGPVPDLSPPDGVRQVPTRRPARPPRPHLAEQDHRARHPAGARSTCATATRP